MAASIHKRSACRVCDSAKVRRFLHFDDMPFTDDFVRSPTATEFRAPIDLFWCEDCHTAQTQHDVDVGQYYRDYSYSVSNSGFAVRFMQLLAENSFRKFGFKPGDRVIEVGSGDGAQLACYQKIGAKVLGFEPSDPLVAASNAAGVPVVQCLFKADTIDQIPADMRPAQVILLTYTFDHLPDPLQFLDAVRSVLDPERGIVLIEVHDLDKIVRRRETCLFEHEHSVYLTAKTMKQLLARAGFKLLSTEIVPEADRRGNSLLIAAGLEGGTQQADASAEATGFDRYDDWATYAGFQAEVQASLGRLRDRVRAVRAKGGRVAGYGAGGRGVMTLAQSGLTADDVAYLCDQNTGFHGLLTPVTRIPVAPPSRINDEPVDEVIVFSFGYMREIAAMLSDHTARGGRLTSMLDAL